MVNPGTPPRKNQGEGDNFGECADDDDFETPPGVTRKKRAPMPGGPLSPVSLNMREAGSGVRMDGRCDPASTHPPRNSNKRARSVDTEEEEEEEEEDEEAGAPDEDPRGMYRGTSSGKLIFQGPIVGRCEESIAAKLRERSLLPPVGTHLLLTATRDEEGGLRGALEHAKGLVGLAALYEASGAEITIDYEQIGREAAVLEATEGMCNNLRRNFHKPGSTLLTAREHRVVVAAVPISAAGGPIIAKNGNHGGCEQVVHPDGRHNCRETKTYPVEQQEASQQINTALYEKLEQDCPGARVLAVHHFGNFNAKIDEDEDGKPVVTRKTTKNGLVVLEARGRHLKYVPSSPAGVLSTVEVRVALRVHADREMGKRVDRTDEMVKKGVLDVLENVATGKQENRAGLDADKTAELLAIIDGLREKQSLGDVVAGVERFRDRLGGRMFDAESASKGARASTVDGVKAEVPKDVLRGDRAASALEQAVVDKMKEGASTGGHRQQQQLRPHRRRDRGGREGARGGRTSSRRRRRHREAESSGEEEAGRRDEEAQAHRAARDDQIRGGVCLQGGGRRVHLRRTRARQEQQLRRRRAFRHGLQPGWRRTQ